MHDRKELEGIVRRSYAASAEVAHYRDRAGEGLRTWERSVVTRFMTPTRVLVVGCGGGREAFALEARGYDVVGIDIVEEQIESARSNARHRGSEAIFRAYDGNDMPFPDERFGAVTFWSQVLGNVPGSAGRHRLLREAHRVLEPGGVLSLSVHDRRRSLSLLQDSEVYRYRLLPSAEPGDLVVRGASEHECYWHYFDASELIDLCRDAGFSRVQVQTTGGLGEDWDNVLVAVCEKA